MASDQEIRDLNISKISLENHTSPLLPLGALIPRRSDPTPGPEPSKPNLDTRFFANDRVHHKNLDPTLTATKLGQKRPKQLTNDI